MDLEILKSKIESLDPGVHGALREALAAKYRTVTGKDQEARAPSDPFDEMFKKAANDLGERYIRGTSDYIRDRHPDLHQKTEEADGRMNEVWTAGRQSKATVEEFREALNEWYLLHLKGIEIYAAETIGTRRGTSE
jgi:hypothetical protein